MRKKVFKVRIRVTKSNRNTIKRRFHKSFGKEACHG